MKFGVHQLRAPTPNTTQVNPQHISRKVGLEQFFLKPAEKTCMDFKYRRSSIRLFECNSAWSTNPRAGSSSKNCIAPRHTKPSTGVKLNTDYYYVDSFLTALLLATNPSITKNKIHRHSLSHFLQEQQSKKSLALNFGISLWKDPQ